MIEIASELKHDKKFTWPFVPRKHRIRYHLNTTGLVVFLLFPLVVIFPIEYNSSGVSKDLFLNLAERFISVYINAPIMAVVIIFLDKYTKYAITTNGIYKFRLLKTRFANEDILFPWDKIKVIKVRKSGFCWFAWDWTAVVHLRSKGIMGALCSHWFKIGLDDERLQEFLGVIQQCAPEKLSLDGNVLCNQNKSL